MMRRGVRWRGLAAAALAGAILLALPSCSTSLKVLGQIAAANLLEALQSAMSGTSNTSG